MEFFRRFIWYLFGVGIGVVMVIIMFGKRNDITFNYLPSARIKGNISSKIINYNKQTLDLLNNAGLDSTNISELLVNGDVDISKSNKDLDSCKIYYIENEEMIAIFENCDSTVNIINVESLK